MNNGDVRERLERLDERLTRIERVLGLEAPAARESEPAPIEPETVAALASEEALSPPQLPPPLPPPLPVLSIESELPPPTQLTTEPPVHVDYAPAPPPLSPPVRSGGLEQTIGLKWAGWIGAIVLVIGAGFGIKFAVDQGWLGQVPPAVRLILMYAGGFAILAAGEVVYRRINAISAAAIFGAGVATLYLVSYAGHGLYKLYDPQTAFVLMGASTLIGAAVAVRGRLVSIAILSLLGGNIAPFVMGGQPQIVPFLSYLLMLQVVALALAWWGNSQKWWILRWFALVTTSLWMIVIMPAGPAGGGYDPRGAPLMFTLIYAALFQLELIASAIRTRRSAATGGVMFSMVVTAAALSAVLYAFDDASPTLRGAWVIGFAIATVILGFALSTRAPATTLAAIAIGFRIQAAALVVVAVPVALSGIWVTLAWGVLGVAFAVAGRSLNLNISRAAGIATWMLAVANLLHVTADRATAAQAREIWLTLLGEGIEAYALIAFGMALLGHAIAWLVGGEQAGDAPETRRQWAGLTGIVASLVWIVASVAALPPLGATACIVAFAWLLFAVDRFAPAHALLLWHSIGAIVLAAVKWVVVDTLAQRLSPGWAAAQHQPFLNPVMAMGGVIALSLLGVYWLRRRELAAMVDADHAGAGRNASVLLLVLAAVFAILTFGITIEVDRVVEQQSSAAMAWPRAQVKQLTWTMLWMTAIVGYIALAAKIGPSAAAARQRSRWLAGLPILLAVKFLVIDTLAFRLFDRPAPVEVLFNLQGLAALFVFGGLAWIVWLCTTRDETGIKTSNPIAQLIGFLAILVLLWTGSLEIDRYFDSPGVDRAKQVGLSIYWGAFAIACVVAGFRFRVAGLRYFGLGLFAVTLVKIVLVDLANIGPGYRILSFMGLGLLLLGTSVLYGKLSPRLLKQSDDAGDAHPR